MQKFCAWQVAQAAETAVEPDVVVPFASLPCPPSAKSGASCDFGFGKLAMSWRVSVAAAVTGTWHVAHAWLGTSTCGELNPWHAMHSFTTSRLTSMRGAPRSLWHAEQF